MKVAVLKLGARIAISSSGTSGGTGEVVSIIKMLTTAGCEVDAFTKILRKDETPTEFRVFNIEDYYDKISASDYDCLLVLNGSVNFFGGAEDRAQILNYHIINHFAGKVFYILCDPNLMLRQIWHSITVKPWASNYRQEDIEITRDDIVYISQPRKIDRVKEIANKFVKINTVVHYPFEQFPLLTTNSLPYNEYPTYDLLYGGTFRGGKRELDMAKFYFGIDGYNVTMFGKIENKNFKPENIAGLSDPNYEDSVPYDKFTEKMNQSKATVIIGDGLYKELNDLAQRIYESVNAGNIILIDASYDHDKLVFKNEELRKFNYVNTKADVIDRLAKLQNESFRRYIYNLQKEDIAFDRVSYANGFRRILEEN